MPWGDLEDSLEFLHYLPIAARLKAILALLEVGKWMEKYLKGAAEFPTEHRLRVVRFLQAMTGGPLAAALHHSGGPMQNQKIIIFRETDFEAKKKRVRVLTGIEKEG